MNKTTQRVFIWIIAIAMIVGTIGAFVGIILDNNNRAKQQEELTKQLQQQQQQACEAAVVPEGSVYTKPESVTFEKDSVTELKTEDVKVGEGKEVTNVNDCVTVHYLGNTSDGKVFDNSYDRGQPIAFTLSGVIQGWQEGLIGMKEGGARKIFIPSEKAYGEQGAPGAIGPNEPLYFYVELIDVK